MDFLTSLTLSNYKSFLHTEVPLMPLTVFVGRNSAGKSSVIEALDFLRLLVDHSVQDACSMHGGFEHLQTQLLDDQGVKKFTEIDHLTLSIRFATSRDVQLAGADILYRIQGGEYYFDLQIQSDKDRSSYIYSQYAVMHESSNKEWMIVSPNEDTATTITYKHLLDKKQYEEFRATVYNRRPHETLLTKEPFFLPVLRELLESCVIFNFDSRRMKEAIPLNSGKRLQSDGANIAVVLREILSDAQNAEDFSHILRYVFPHISEIATQKFTHQHIHLALREDHAPSWLLPSSLFSDGTVYMLALIVVLFFDDRPMVIIEEPDRYLHPAMMSTLARLLEDASQKKQVIITTHNPLLVKHIPLEHLLVVHRNSQGESKVLRAHDSASVQTYLESDNVDIADVMIHDMFL